MELEKEKRAYEAEQKEREMELEKEKRAYEMELEKEKRAYEAAQREQELALEREKNDAEERRLQLQLELARISRESDENSSGHSSPRSNQSNHGSDPAMSFHLENFDDRTESIDDYLDRFENISELHNLPHEKKALKLSLSLRGIAYQLYAALSPTDKQDYDIVKECLFRHFQVTADSYRRKFRNAKKKPHETYVQLSNRLDMYLLKWIKLSGLEPEFEDLKSAVILEQIKNTLPTNTNTFTEEMGAKTLDQVIKLADQHCEAHKDYGRLKNPHHTRDTSDAPPRNLYRPEPPNSHQGAKHGPPLPKLGHNKGTRRPSFSEGQTKHQNKPWCHRCKTNRHAFRDCKNNYAPHNTLAVTKTAFAIPEEPVMVNHPVHPPIVESIKINGHTVSTLYDTGLDFDSVICEKLVRPEQYTGATIKLQCATYAQEPMELKIAHIEIDCAYVRGTIPAAVLQAPIYDCILGAKYVYLHRPTRPVIACPMTTRAQAVETAKQDAHENPQTAQIKLAQQSDPTLKKCFAKLPHAHDPPKRGEYIQKNGLLFRMHKDEHTQLVIPSAYRQQILDTGHTIAFSGHAGIGATIQRICTHFTWPGVSDDIKRYVRSCPTCQRKNTRTNLVPVTLGEMPVVGTAFERCALDIIGPLPVTRKKNRFILTLIDCCTMWTEAIALPRIDAKTVAEALISIFTRLGFPRQILTDNGSQLCGRLMKEVFQVLHAQHITTSVYHPQSNGQVERFNGTLIAILKKIVNDKPELWDTYLAPALYAYREVPHTSTGIAPATLLFGRPIAGPLDALKAQWTNQQIDETSQNASKYVQELKSRLNTGWAAAAEALKKARKRNAKYYNKKAKDRKLNAGDQVLLLLPQGNNKLEISWQGPYNVVARSSRTNYKIQIGKKVKTYHINLLKKYHERQPVNHLMALTVAEDVISTQDHALDLPLEENETHHDVIMDSNLTPTQQHELTQLVARYAPVFTDKPGLTDLAQVDFKLTDHTPIRSKPYPVPLARESTIDTEIQKMLDNKIISPSTSPYSSPIILLRKPNGEHRLCVDFRKVNTVIEFQTEPLPNQERIFAKLHHAKYFSKLDLSKGYYQIPVPPRLRQYLAFSTPKGHYQFNVLPFGLHIAPSIFSRMMVQLLGPLQNADIIHFMDDCLVASETWESHLNSLETLLKRLRDTQLTARPTKCNFGFKELDFLGHHLQEGAITPETKNVEKLLAATRPKTKKDVRSFLGMCGYYQKYIPQYSHIAAPLFALTRKSRTDKIIWTAECEHSFTKLKDYLTTKPILQLPNPSKPYTLRTDAAKSGLAACLMQQNTTDAKALHPIAFASRTLSPAEQNYSTVELECLAIVWAIQKFQLYLYGSHFNLQTDNQPLLFLACAPKLNAKLMRWSLILQQYTYTVEHIKGTDNHFADYLSRHLPAREATLQ